MSAGWTDIEAPNAPDGLADTGESSDAAVRVDEVTGDTPGNVSGDDFDGDKYINQTAPLAVVVVEEVQLKRGRILLSTGSARVNDGSTMQVVGSSIDPDRSVKFKIDCLDAQDNSDYALVAPERENLDYGYRLDHLLPEEFNTQDDMFVKAVGGDVIVYWAVMKVG